MNTDYHGAIKFTRRRFLGTAAAVGGLGLLFQDGFAELLVQQNRLREDIFVLLRDWCDALVRLQVDDPKHPELHGSFRCPACSTIHGRCGDAAYPLLTMARLTGDLRYHKAAVRVVEWMKNVDLPDGAWTNEPDPKSWKGITVFGSIALANALNHNRALLDTSLQEQWALRLHHAGQFIYDNFNMNYATINYGLTAPYALALLGRLLKEDKWRKRATQLAGEAKNYLTVPNKLIYGECQSKDVNKLSPLGCHAVDLGYNVEESLPSLLHYAYLEKDETLRKAAVDSLAAHLNFMLPDGGWDNSWGTRNFKWTYWGSRTSDGCLSALLLAAKERPVFFEAASRHLGLLRRCTKDGLLHGGPHLASKGIPACVHHTFCHAKVLAEALDYGVPDMAQQTITLPREDADGLCFYPEIATWLAARGPWRATVTRYDWFYKPNAWHATGGTMAMLWHKAAGPLLVSSLAEYVPVEPHNMQPPPDARDFPLTMRVERIIEGERFSNLCDVNASVQATDENGMIRFDVQAALCNTKGKPSGDHVRLAYHLSKGAVNIKATVIKGNNDRKSQPRLVLPIVSDRSETIRRISDKRIAVEKPESIVTIESDTPIDILNDDGSRVFNLIPGFMAIPIAISLLAGQTRSVTVIVSTREDGKEI